MSVRRFCRPSALRTIKLLRRRATYSRSIIATGRSSILIPHGPPIEEERVPGYSPKSFLHTNPGDLLNGRYKILVKVGWGTTSTVWLARDTKRGWFKRERLVIIKITMSNDADEESVRHERILTGYLDKDPSHNGYIFVRSMLDYFEVQAPSGRHLCLVFEPLREPLSLSIFQQRWGSRNMPPTLVALYLRFILRGLDYVHTECHIVHTDLKLDNIMLTFEDPAVLEDYVKLQANSSMPQKTRDGRSTYISHNEFGPFRSLRLLPKLTDFGLAQYGGGPAPLLHPIQPHAYHAPEVLLNTGWSYSADIWNLGVLVWNMMEGRDLFTHLRSNNGTYDVRAHLAEMIALRGPPPKKLIERERQWRGVKWSHAIPNEEGNYSQTACEYYGGPFFDDRGEFMYKELIPSGLCLEDTVTAVDGEEKRLFLAFIRRMLQWLHEDRKTAQELIDDPWLIAMT